MPVICGYVDINIYINYSYRVLQPYSDLLNVSDKHTSQRQSIRALVGKTDFTERGNIPGEISITRNATC